MYSRIILVFVYLICVSGSGIYHENTKVTLEPDLESEYFGFSVVLTRYGVIVGAPKAKSRDGPNPVASGLAFNCSLDNLDSKIVICNPVGPGVKRNFGRFRSLIPDSFFKDDMWFGATIASLADGKLLICAPRYTEPYSTKHLLSHGVCSLRRRDRDSVIYPLNEGNRQAFMTDGQRRQYGDYGTHLNFYAYGQAGMSVKVIGNSVIIGAPGLLQWTGGIVYFNYYPQESSSYFSKQVIANPYYTHELGPDEYFGYSVEAGIFEPDGDTLFVAGAPRSGRGYGQVLIFEPATREHNPLKVHAKVHGPQLGAYFGASLCCLDLDGDGLSDLLVGAPNYVKKDGGLPYDQGAVFVYFTKHDGNNLTLEEAGYVMGSSANGARFGTVIADLEDVDGDGFRDVAIGAPWEDDGSGAVYIYRGSAKGLKNQYVQRIVAEGARTFGISISKGLDIDQNNCHDLAVGAALSSTVYVYRCVPTITVHVTIRVPDAMNLPHNATGFPALFCVNATERPMWPHVKAAFNTRIVIDPEENRATLSGDTQSKGSITPGEELCTEQNVEVKPTADLSKPILMKFFLEPDELLKNDSTMFNPHAARISEESILKSSFLIQLVRDCGEDMICTPWLEMTLTNLASGHYVPGSGDLLGVRLTIVNKEEPAYGARVKVTLPLTPKRLPSPCSLEDLVLTCDVPAPLLRGEELSMDIELEYKESHMMQDGTREVSLKVTAELDDPLYERNITNEPIKEITIEIQHIAVFDIVGKPQPNDTIPITREKLYEAGDILFSHYVEMSNFGPSHWLLEFTITLPDMVNMSISIPGCEEIDGAKLECTWYVPAKVSRSAVLPLQFDLDKHGELLKQNTSLNITTIIQISNIFDGNRTAVLTTTLILDPAPPIWPVILGTVAGLLLLAAIVYFLHKYGFFSRQQRQKLKELQDQTQPLTQNETGNSTDSTSMEPDESTLELLCDDSD